MTNYQESLKKLSQTLPEARENVVLRDFTTMGVGGVADLFYKAKDILSLTKAVSLAIENHVPFLVLGNGSNVIISDSGYPGLVIINQSSNIVRVPETSQLIVDSGVTLGHLISEVTNQELTGLEFLAGIPGTVGGAVWGNAGMRGLAIGQFVKEVTLLHPPKGKLGQPQIIRHKAEWMEFDYRTSKLKKEFAGKLLEIERPVILTVRLGLAPAKKEDIIKRINENIESRRHLPRGKSAGCIFKNPERTPEKSAGALIEKARLKKLRVGDAFVSPLHANFIINKNRATAAEIRELIEQVRKRVNEKFGIQLEEEVEYIGRW